MVTDIVESTRLRARLGDHTAEEVRRRHQRIVESATRRHLGEVVRWEGDGVVATFPSATAAARAGVSLQRAIDLENRRSDEERRLAVRVGVSAGEVGLPGSGPTVEAAHQLCDSALGGQVLVSRVALELAGTRAKLRAAPSSGPVSQLLWTPLAATPMRLGIPPGLRTVGQLPFVGRERELDTLLAALDAAWAGRGQLALIEGEAGIGKTRLAAELARAALGRGSVVLCGAAPEGLSLPYAPVVQALEYWLDHVDEPELRLVESGGELVRLAPRLATRVRDLPPPTQADAEFEQQKLFEAVGEWVASVALDDPLVLVLDSLHWASLPTFELLHRVLREIASFPVLIAVTHRPDAAVAGRLQAWGEQLLGAPAVHRLRLSGLDVGAIENLLASVAERPSSRPLGSSLHHVTRGNPLHVAELLSPDAAGRREGAELPNTIRAAMRQNVASLDASTRSTLEHASVLGGEFPATELADVVGDRDAVFEALDRAVGAGLLRESDRENLRYEFVHDLTRETVYTGIGAARLARLHERAGLALESMSREGARISDLARHFLAAKALGHAERAGRYAAKAAEAALEQYANQQAAELFDAARDLLEGDAERCDALIGLGEALRRQGETRYHTVLADAATMAEGMGDGERMGRALLTGYRGAFSRAARVDEAQVARLRRALDLMPDADSPLRVRLLAQLGVETVWQADRTASRETSDLAVAAARRLDDKQLQAEVLAHRLWTVFHPLEDRLEAARELAELTSPIQDPLLRFEAASSDVFTAVRAGERERLDAALATARSEAGQLDQPLVRWMLLSREFCVALMEARFEEAADLADQSVVLGRQTGQQDWQEQQIVQQFWLELESAPSEMLVPKTRATVGIHDRLDPMTWPPMGMLCCELGLEDEARRLLASISERGLGAIPVDQMWLITLCELAVIVSHLGETSLCEGLLASLEPCASEHGNWMFSTVGAAARYVGLLQRTLGRYEESEQSLATAVQANEGIGAVTWLARSRLDLAELRLARRGKEDAEGRRLLAAAAADATTLRLPRVLDRAQQVGARYSA